MKSLKSLECSRPVCVIYSITALALATTSAFGADKYISNSPGGSGNQSGDSADNASDGSTSALFTSVMNSIPTNTTIHLIGPNPTYSVQHAEYWPLKSGQHLLGLGMYSTTLVLDPTSVVPLHDPPQPLVDKQRATVVASWIGKNPSDPNPTGIIVSDMTVDCGGYNFIARDYLACDGVYLRGTQMTIRNVRAISFLSNGPNDPFTDNHESFPIAISNGDRDPDETGINTMNSANNVIDNCVVSHFVRTSKTIGTTAIQFGGSGFLYGKTISGTIRNCQVYLDVTDTTVTGMMGFGLGGTSVTLESNAAFYCSYAFWSDTGPISGVTVLSNNCYSCSVGVGIILNTSNSCSVANLTISGNKIQIYADPLAWAIGIGFGNGENPDYTHSSNISLTNNQFTTVGCSSGCPCTPPGQGLKVNIQYTAGVTVSDNCLLGQSENNWLVCDSNISGNQTDMFTIRCP